MQTDFKTTAGLFAYLFARLMTSVLSVGAKIRKNRPRCSPRGGFLCSFNNITPKSPHSKPFPIPFASLLGVILPLTSHVDYVDFGDTTAKFQAAFSAITDQRIIIGRYAPTYTYCVIGWKGNNDYGGFVKIGYDEDVISKCCKVFGGQWTWY